MFPTIDIISSILQNLLSLFFNDLKPNAETEHNAKITDMVLFII